MSSTGISMDAGKIVSGGRYYGVKHDDIVRAHDSEVFVHNLRIEEAMASEAGRNVARIDSSSMILLGIKAGDVLVINGSNGRKAAASCQDSIFLEIEPVIRLDKVMRYNLSVEIGELMYSSSIAQVIRTPQICKEVSLEPISLAVPPVIDEQYVKRALDGTAVVKGQVVIVPYYGNRWFPYVVSNISGDSPITSSSLIVGEDTVVNVEWHRG